MKILVCIKHGGEGKEMARLDAQALEASLVLKESPPQWLQSPIEIIALTLGPRGEDILHRALGMGADQGIWLRWGSRNIPPFETAACLADLGQDADLILTGLQSETGMSGNVAPFMGGILKCPVVLGIVEMTWGTAPDSLSLVQEMEGGICHRLSLTLPGVLGIQSGAFIPRYPSLSNVLKARTRPLTIQTPNFKRPGPQALEDLGQIPPRDNRRGEDWHGSQAAHPLCQWLSKGGFI